jgi:hypothetical protein
MITQEELEVLVDTFIQEPIVPQCRSDSCPITFKSKTKEDENNGS